MDLVPYIFHEQQEAGSQLCAQHCLNNLLQQPVYTEIDLADIARKLDQQENAAKYTAPESKSYNYDDTGFFSISVLEKAMQVWDLTLVRWRGEAMRPYQDAPEEQAAFILNLASHWFALRRFAHPTRWYNLNSFLPQPEWVSPNYLHMVLKQAEAEGYSVFVVRRNGEDEDAAGGTYGEEGGWQDGGVGIMPESGADTMAVELGPVHARSGTLGSGTVGKPDTRQWMEAGPSGTQGTDQDEPMAGSGRRRRRQQDLVSDEIDFDDMLAVTAPRSGSRTPQPSRSYVEVAGAAAQREQDEEIEERLANPDIFPGYTNVTDFQYANRSYDDEDAALQAALRASMEDVPEGWIMPELPAKEVVPKPRSQRETTPPPQPSPPKTQVDPPTPAKSTSTVTDEDEGPAQSLSPDEIRRARLARFNA